MTGLYVQILPLKEVAAITHPPPNYLPNSLCPDSPADWLKIALLIGNCSVAKRINTRKFPELRLRSSSGIGTTSTAIELACT